MKRVLLAALLAFAQFTGFTANATVLTFEDVPGVSPNGVGLMPSVHNGYTFNSTAFWIDTVGSAYNYGAHSGEITVLNNFTGAVIISAEDGSDFTFDGVWAETWARQAERMGTIRGFNNGVEVWTVHTTLTSNFQFYAGVAGDIDQLHLDLGNFFLFDDLALNPAAAIPEPGSLALLGLGLAGFAAARRRATHA